MTMSRPRTHRAFAVVACALLLALTGCSILIGKEDDMEIRTVPDASDQVNHLAQQVADLVGDTKLEEASTNDAPCSGRWGELAEDIFYILGTYQVPLPHEEHIPTLARLRDHWQQQGYTIRDHRTFSHDNTGSLAVTTPDGYKIRLMSTVPPTALALFVSTPCYKSPEVLY